MTDIGSIVDDGDTRTVRFERHLAAEPGQVWLALTEPERLADWLTMATFEGRAGGEVRFDFGEGGVCTGTVITFDPPAVLEYEWNFPNEHRSIVRWELTAADDVGTVVVLTHRLLEPATTPGYGAGWHAHLDQLAGHLVGATPDWVERYTALRPDYDALAAAKN